MSGCDRFDNYEIVRRDDGSIVELGRGAMGVTYKARDLDLHCDVALKVINPAIIDGPNSRERFLREARAAAQLRHPNIASVFRLGKADDDTHFYAMEFCNGPTLEQAVAQRGPFSATESLRITAQVCRALMIAEQNRLVHRDIKPANLILTESHDEGTVVKVIDFGLAKSFADGMQTLATMGTGGFAGTAHFASPEQLEEGELDIRSDIYSLGVCLWFMLAGSPPYQGSMAKVMSQTLSNQPPWEKLASQRPAVVALLRRMLAKNPDDRPQGGPALKTEIEDCLRVVESPEAETEVPRVAASATVILPATFEARYSMSESVGRDALGRIFRGTDATRGGAPVAVRVIDPMLSVVPAVRREIEAQLAAARDHPHKHLLGPLDFTSGPDGFLVATDWSDGFTVLDLLKQRGTLTPAEAMLLLAPLAKAADHATRHGLRGLNLSKEQIVIHFPNTDAAARSHLLATGLGEWPEHVVKAGTLSLGDSGLASEVMLASMATIAPAAGVRGIALAGVPAVAHVACELLGGRGGDAFAPLPRLSEAGNAVLRRVFTDATAFPNAVAFIEALRATLGNASATSLPQPQATIPLRGHPPSSTPWKRFAVAALIAITVVGIGTGYYFGISQPRDREQKQRADEASAKAEEAEKIEKIVKAETLSKEQAEESEAVSISEAAKTALQNKAELAAKSEAIAKAEITRANERAEAAEKLLADAEEKAAMEKANLAARKIKEESGQRLAHEPQPQQLVEKLQDSVWLFPDSSNRRLMPTELKLLNAEQLWRARNEIYARNGLIFSTPRGKAFAASLGAAYRGTDSDQERITNRMSQTEQLNIELIKSLERRH